MCLIMNFPITNTRGFCRSNRTRGITLQWIIKFIRYPIARIIPQLCFPADRFAPISYNAVASLTGQKRFQLFLQLAEPIIYGIK